jgi:hypothetical protein
LRGSFKAPAKATANAERVEYTGSALGAERCNELAQFIGKNNKNTDKKRLNREELTRMKENPKASSCLMSIYGHLLAGRSRDDYVYLNNTMLYPSPTIIVMLLGWNE